MNGVIRSCATALILGGSLIASACGGHDKSGNTANGDVATPAANAPATGVAPTSSAPVAVDSAPAPHHSKLGGAVAGAAVGHMLGGHAVLGAATGAIIQHERNKH
jgi:hypothetical protein